MPPKQTGLNLQTLSIEQLQQLKRQIDQEIESLTHAIASLRGARERFYFSKAYLESLKKYEPGQETFVPMSSSLYVRGELTNNTKALVDVGTGYFIEQSVGRAQVFFEKRMAQMAGNIDEISKILSQKQKVQNQVIDIMQKKSQSMMQTAQN